MRRVRLHRLAVPLRTPFRTSFGTQTDRDVVLVEVTTGDGATGWGECVAPADPVYSSEHAAGALDVLRRFLAPAVVGVGDLHVTDVARVTAATKGHPMARAALEQAVLDAALRTAGASLADALGVEVDRVPCGVSVGIPSGGPPALVDAVGRHLDEGYLRVKCKVEPGFDVAPLAAVRAAFPDAALQVDANAAYVLGGGGPDDADVLAGLDELGLVLVEQPLAADALLDHARLAERLATPLCLDESITSVTRTRDALDLGACTILNLKPGRIGGVLPTLAVHATCVARGVPTWIGGMLETGVARAVNVALAGLDGIGFPGDTSASDRYVVEDLTEPFVLADGHLPVPREPGASRAPLPDRLAAATSAPPVDVVVA
ncbi:MAG: o-succinylbenzoate synthase [Actinomycetes bacterium]